MYLETRSQNGMIESICNLLSISGNELRLFLLSAIKESQTERYFDGCRFERLIDGFIDEHIGSQGFDELLFFHLGRRLNTAIDSYDGKNLYDLLLTDNPFSSFLRQYHLNFYEEEGHIDIKYKGKKVNLSDIFDTNVCYLRSRLGYNSSQKDFCFNGFAFKDILYKNPYARNLSRVPEIINGLCSFLEFNELEYAYMDQSKYYCFEYLIPLENVIFDGFSSNETIQQKQRHLLRAVITRINDYINGDIRFNNDNDNPILRIADFCILNSKYYINKEEITAKMILD